MIAVLVLVMVMAPPRIVVPQASVPPTQSPAKRMAGSVSTDAERFADLYLPDEIVRAKQRDGIRRMLETGFDANPRAVAAERQRPGMRAAWVAGGLAQLARFQDARLPARCRQVADALAAAFTPGEIAQIAAFYASDAGRAMVAAVYAHLDPVMDGDGRSTRERLRRQLDARGVERSLDARARAGVAAFGATATGRKFNRWSPRLTAQLLAITDETWALDNPRIQAAADAAMHRFMAATPARSVR